MSCSHELGVSSMVETVASLDYCFGVWLPSYYYFFFIPQNLLHFPVISPTLAVRAMKILALSSLHIHTLSYNSMILKTTTPLPLSSYSPATHQRISQVSWIGCTLNYPSSSLTWTVSVHKPPTRCICFPQGVGLCTGTWGEMLIKALLFFYLPQSYVLSSGTFYPLVAGQKAPVGLKAPQSLLIFPLSFFGQYWWSHRWATKCNCSQDIVLAISIQQPLLWACG